MPPTFNLLLSAIKMSISLYEAFSVGEEVLKSNCSTAKILFVSICLIVSYIISSKTLENEVSKETGL